MLERGMEMKCGNCYWFNGEENDGEQFCDDREIDVYEDGYCLGEIQQEEED